MKKTIFALALTAILGSNCSETVPVLSTQLNQISAGVVVTCDPYVASSEAHSCLVLANPLRPVMRVFDASQRQFLLAPIGYAPLAVRVNGMIEQLGSYENGDASFVFAYDLNSPSVTALNARNGANSAPSFATLVTPRRLDLGDRALRVFVVSKSNPASSDLLAVYVDGSFQFSTFDVSSSSFGEPQPRIGPVDGATVDAAYDSASGVLALLVNSEGRNRVVIRNVIEDGGIGPANTIEDVGNVKIALGPFKTGEVTQPHLLLMKQDAHELRILRINRDNLEKEKDNTIKLVGSVTKAYFPVGEQKESWAGKKDWLVVSSDHGLVHYLTDTDILDTDAEKVFKGTFEIHSTRGLAANNVNGLQQIIGSDIHLLSDDPRGRAACAREMFFIFGSGVVASVCEGQNIATPIVSR